MGGTEEAGLRLCLGREWAKRWEWLGLRGARGVGTCACMAGLAQECLMW